MYIIYIYKYIYDVLNNNENNERSSCKCEDRTQRGNESQGEIKEYGKNSLTPLI